LFKIIDWTPVKQYLSQPEASLLSFKLFSDHTVFAVKFDLINAIPFDTHTVLSYE